MTALEFELNDYLKDIKRNMICSNSIKKLFIKDFKNRIDEFIDENPNTSIDDIINNFGNPEDIVRSFNDELEYYKNKSRKRLIIVIVISVVSLVIIGLLGVAIADMIKNYGGDITVTS